MFKSIIISIEDQTAMLLFENDHWEDNIVFSSIFHKDIKEVYTPNVAIPSYQLERVREGSLYTYNSPPFVGPGYLIIDLKAVKEVDTFIQMLSNVYFFNIFLDQQFTDDRSIILKPVKSNELPTTSLDNLRDILIKKLNIIEQLNIKCSVCKEHNIKPNTEVVYGFCEQVGNEWDIKPKPVCRKCCGSIKYLANNSISSLAVNDVVSCNACANLDIYNGNPSDYTLTPRSKHDNKLSYSKCRRCIHYDALRTYQCSLCEVEEYRVFSSPLVLFLPSGTADERDPACLNCGVHCGRCGMVVDPRGIYKKCPCIYPSSFSSMIQPYNAKAEDSLPMDRQPQGEFLFGMEIETGVSCKHRSKYTEIFKETHDKFSNDCIFVYDRSIDEIDTSRHISNTFRGFEMVTRPMNYKNMRDFISRLTLNKPRYLESWNVKTAGVHIHISKNVLNKQDLANIILFINKQENRNFVKSIGRRVSRYARYSRKLSVEDALAVYKDMHYEAINNSKEHTLEFRIFRGSLNYNALMSYLEFVKSLVEFCKSIDNIDNLLYKSYQDWLFKTSDSSYIEIKSRILDLEQDKRFWNKEVYK